MRRKPRSSKAGIFAGGMGIDILYQGLIVAALTLFSYFLGHYLETGVWSVETSADGMTMAFLTMSMAEIFHSLNMRSQRKSLFTMKKQNKMLLLAAVGSLIATTAVCEIPFLAAAFGFASVNFTEYAIAILLGACIIPIVELVKFFQRRRAKDREE